MRKPAVPALDRRRPSPDRSGDDRRTRTRLRELCDEVLASHRVANGQDPLTADDRAAATAILPQVAPLDRA